MKTEITRWAQIDGDPIVTMLYKPGWVARMFFVPPFEVRFIKHEDTWYKHSSRVESKPDWGYMSDKFSEKVEKQENIDWLNQELENYENGKEA